MESSERKERAKRLIGYGLFFEIADLMNENTETLVGYLLNLNNIEDNHLKYFHSLGFDETLRRNEKGLKTKNKVKYEKSRNHELIKKGALLEIADFFIERDILKYDNEVVLGYLLEYSKMTSRDKISFYNIGKVFLEEREKIKEKKKW